MIMYCEFYKCTMNPFSCIARQKNAASDAPGACHKPGFRDPACIDCEMGREIMAKHGGKKAEKWSKQLKALRNRARKSTWLFSKDVEEKSMTEKQEQERADVEYEPVTPGGVDDAIEMLTAHRDTFVKKAEALNTAIAVLQEG